MLCDGRHLEVLSHELLACSKRSTVRDDDQGCEVISVLMTGSRDLACSHAGALLCNAFARGGTVDEHKDHVHAFFQLDLLPSEHREYTFRVSCRCGRCGHNL